MGFLGFDVMVFFILTIFSGTVTTIIVVTKINYSPYIDIILDYVEKKKILRKFLTKDI